MRGFAWVAVLAVSLGCSTPPGGSEAAAPLGIRGVDRVLEACPGRYVVVSSRGIGSFRIRLEARQPVTVVLAHTDDRPFTRLEGLTVSTLPHGAVLPREELASQGRLVTDGPALAFDPGPAPIDWRVDFVDAYR